MVPAVRRRRPGSARALALALDGPDRGGHRRAGPGRRRGRRGGAEPARPGAADGHQHRRPGARHAAPGHHPHARARDPAGVDQDPAPESALETPEGPDHPDPDRASPLRDLHHRLGRKRRIAGLRPERRRRLRLRGRLRQLQPALRPAARHRRRLHLQPLQPSRQLLRRPQPHDRRRPRHLLDRPGQPRDRAEHGRGRADQPQVAEEALGARAREHQQGHGRAGLRHGRKAGARLDHRPGLGRAVGPAGDQEDQHPLQAAQAQVRASASWWCGSARPLRRPSARPPRPAT